MNGINSDLCGVYERILQDEEWHRWMKRIQKLSTNGESQELYADHGMRHAMRVAEYAANFIDECHQFFANTKSIRRLHSMGHEEDFYLASIAGLLHDIGVVKGREKHAARSKQMAAKYLVKFGMTEEEIAIIAGAIGVHSSGDEIVNLVDAAVMMGDKMDITMYRMVAYYHNELKSLMTPAQQQFMNIKRVNFIIDELYGHGVLEWGVIMDSEATNDLGFNDRVDRMTQTILSEWPKCLSIPQRVTEDFLGLRFAFIVDDLTP